MRFITKKREIIIILIAALIAVGIAVINIEIFGNYGAVLFLFLPLLIGLIPSLIINSNEYTKSEYFIIGFTTLSIFSMILFFIGIEGMICLAMAAPLGVILTLIGSLIAYGIKHKFKKDKNLIVIFLVVISFPLCSYIDNNVSPSLHSVKTKIEINANINDVWNNVVAFPKLDKPNEYIFKAGISYPIEATIQGKGKGAIRYCKFNAGDFVEPITEWNEPNLLSFNVDQQPVPMTELSFYDIDAPHLHDYFLSKKGEFRLTKISETKTILEGTTWYTHNIKPEIYWKLWSNYIIHKIHYRVLDHIKANSEKIKSYPPSL